MTARVSRTAGWSTAPRACRDSRREISSSPSTGSTGGQASRGLPGRRGYVKRTGRLPAAEYFRNPAVDLRVAIYATVLLVLAGTLAGLVPARRAAAVRPIEALRDE